MAALELRLGDHALAHLLAQAQVEHLLERGRRERPEVAQRLGVAEAEVALGVAGLEERLAEQVANEAAMVAIERLMTLVSSRNASAGNPASSSTFALRDSSISSSVIARSPGSRTGTPRARAASSRNSASSPVSSTSSSRV